MYYVKPVLFPPVLKSQHRPPSGMRRGIMLIMDQLFILSTRRRKGHGGAYGHVLNLSGNNSTISLSGIREYR